MTQLNSSSSSSPQVSSLKARLTASLGRRTPLEPSQQKQQQQQQQQQESPPPPRPNETRKKTNHRATGLRLIKKLPTAKVIGKELLESVFRTADVELVINEPIKPQTGLNDTIDVDSVDISVPEEGRVFARCNTSQLIGCLKTVSARRPPIGKSVGFLGAGASGGEVTSIFLYEPTKVKLPWNGPGLRVSGKATAVVTVESPKRVDVRLY